MSRPNKISIRAREQLASLCAAELENTQRELSSAQFDLEGVRLDLNNARQDAVYWEDRYGSLIAERNQVTGKITLLFAIWGFVAVIGCFVALIWRAS